ncbi:hypothetical protein [Streptomyces sp. SDr-06]|uniref:hypothetical protein n=1 Tax=Streptomyces sp. SDr-06 TaxID=2267702 RepID=UPI001673785E|nr:hypothetical protein [Streptomyces sp. SDr-06]
MAKLSTSSIVLEASYEELALILRGLKALITYETSTAKEDAAVQTLLAELSGE